MLGREVTFLIDVLTGNPPNYEQPSCSSEYVEFVQKALNSAFEHAGQQLDAAFNRQKNIMMKI
jgi:hypothetical protein